VSELASFALRNCYANGDKVMNQEQENLIVELIKNDIKKHSIEAMHPAVRECLDRRVRLAKESLAAFRELKPSQREVIKP
jgi:hypothetical protein